jgi:hypothetical protein
MRAVMGEKLLPLLTKEEFDAMDKRVTAGEALNNEDAKRLLSFASHFLGARASIIQEITETLETRGHWAPRRKRDPSVYQDTGADLIMAVAKALDKENK